MSADDNLLLTTEDSSSSVARLNCVATSFRAATSLFCTAPVAIRSIDASLNTLEYCIGGCISQYIIVLYCRDAGLFLTTYHLGRCQ